MELSKAASRTMLTFKHRRYFKTLLAEKKLFRRELPTKRGRILSCKSSIDIPSRSFTSFDRNSIVGEFGVYAKEYDHSVSSPESFWKEASDSLHWFEKPQTILRRKGNSLLYDWFPDGKINTSYNCLDVHVKDGRGDQTALIYDSPMTDRKEKYTFSELLEKVSLFSGALQDLGVKSGDRVVIYMPLIPQAAIAMLACARIGTSYCFVFLLC